MYAPCFDPVARPTYLSDGRIQRVTSAVNSMMPSNRGCCRAQNPHLDLIHLITISNEPFPLRQSLLNSSAVRDFRTRWAALLLTSSFPCRQSVFDQLDTL